MTKIDLVKELANISGETQKTVKSVVAALETVVENVCKAEDEIKIAGVAISGVHKEARQARNPKTGETVNVPEKTNVKVRVLPSLKKTVNGN